MARFRPKWPDLYRLSPTFFYVTLSVAISHVLYLVDAAMGLSTYYPSRVFTLLFNTVPVQGWVTLHAISAVFIFYGIWKSPALVRWGYLISVSTYSMITLAFTISFIEKPTSLYALSPTFICAVVAAAGFFEYSRYERMLKAVYRAK